MSINSREKGKRGERELAGKLREYGFGCRRGQQYSGANGDADVGIMDGEEWRPVKGYEGLYEISNFGRVNSLPKYNRKKSIIMKQTKNPRDGRLSVILCKDPHTRERITVHRLVAKAFLENPNGYSEINHKDEDPSNNNVKNLEWCTRKYNMNYGTLPARINGKNKKPVCGRMGEKIITFGSVREAKKVGFDSSGIIRSIRSGKKYKGFQWRYI